MQISVESTSELSRKMTVRVPEDKIQEKMEARFSTLARQVKLDGFRPGKVPQRLVKKMFAGQVRSEVIGDLIQASFFDALRETALRPAGAPHIAQQQTEEGHGLEYTASFDVYPEIRPNSIEQLEVRRPISEVTDADLDVMVQFLREQRKSWSIVDRKAQEGDRVTISFKGSAEGERLPDGEVEEFPLVIGSKIMIPGFEERLIGAEAGGHLNFALDFPAEYRTAELAGKSAEFDVDILKVEAPDLPEVDAEFAKAFGIENGDVEAFRADVRKNMERELRQAVHGRLKNAVMDALYENNPIPVPLSLVDQEIDRMMEPYVQRAKKQKLDVKEAVRRESFVEEAGRRVALGLILAEIIKENKIKVNADRVRATINHIAGSYERPQEVIDWYYSNSEELANVEQMVLEDQVVEWVVERAKLTDEPVSFNDLMHPNQQ